MRAKTDAGVDVWMVEVADAAPGSWVHCRYCVLQLFVMKCSMRIQKPFDELVWTSYVHSFRETAFKRSLDQAVKPETAFLRRKRGTDETIFTDVQDNVCVWTLCTLFLGWKHPSSHFQPFNFCSVSSISSCRFHSCIGSLSSLSFCWWTNGSNSQHLSHETSHVDDTILLNN